MTVRIGSLCTGYAGLDLAVAAVFGGTPAWVADPDPAAAAVLAHRFPTVPNLGDLTEVDFTAVPPIDVLCAGFPCQDISHAGRGAGIKEGTRSGLWHHIADAIGVLRPRIVVLENVAAIVVRRPGLDVVLADLARLGLDARWLCLPASAVGAPHRRERWFLVAEDPHRATCGQRGIAAPGQAARGRARADAGRRDRVPAAHAHDLGGPRPGRPARAPQRHAPRSGGDAADPAGHPGRLGERDGRAAADPPGPRSQAGRPGLPGTGATAHPAGHGRDQGRPEPAGIIGGPDAAFGGAAQSPAAWWGPYLPAIRRWEHATGQAAPYPREPAPRGGERLTPPFVEWLMGLPPGWVTDVPGLTRNQQLRLLGNGVLPAHGAAALTTLLDRHATRAGDAA